MTETKRQYAKTENEALATTQAHKNFTNFIVSGEALSDRDRPNGPCSAARGQPFSTAYP